MNIGFIFARGGSKGLPGKNLRSLAGVPLVARAVQAARSSSMIDCVVISTDDLEIASAARDAGAEVPFMRPAALATDDVSELLAWKHAVTTLSELGWPPIETFVSIPATAPLRWPEDIDGCINTLKSTGADLALTVYDSGANPYFNLVVEQDGWYRTVMSDAAFRRQDAPRVMRITPVAYAATPNYVLSTDRLLAGRVAAYEVPPERALDIDTEHEFRLAGILMEKSSRAARH